MLTIDLSLYVESVGRDGRKYVDDLSSSSISLSTFSSILGSTVWELSSTDRVNTNKQINSAILIQIKHAI